MEGNWGRQSTNTRDRATAMMPRMLYDRLDELGIDFGIVYPTAGLGIPRIADDETRRAVIRGFNIVTADYFKELERPADPGRGHSGAHAGGGDRRARIRHQSSSAPRSACSAAACAGHCRPRRGRPRNRPLCAGFDQLGIDSDHDYDPVWQKCRELGIAPTFHTGGRSYGDAQDADAISPSTISAISPTAGHAVAKALVPRRRDPALPRSAFRLPRRRRRLGLPAVLRPDRALGAARRQGARLYGPEQARPAVVAPAGRQIRLCRHRRRTRQARRLADAGRGFADRRRAAGRLCGLQHHPEAGLGRPLRQRRIISAARPTTG